MSQLLVNFLVSQLDGAFEGDREHSLLGNLRNVGDDDWLWTPPGGERSIHDIVEHVGWAKYMYENHAFGDGSLRWDDPLIAETDQPRPKAQAIEWVHDGHHRLLDSVRALADADLDTMRRAHWGEQRTARRLIEIMVTHDFYHAGEINHLRALRQGNDHWDYHA